MSLRACISGLVLVCLLAGCSDGPEGPVRPGQSGEVLSDPAGIGMEAFRIHSWEDYDAIEDALGELNELLQWVSGLNRTLTQMNDEFTHPDEHYCQLSSDNFEVQSYELDDGRDTRYQLIDCMLVVDQVEVWLSGSVSIQRAQSPDDADVGYLRQRFEYDLVGYSGQEEERRPAVLRGRVSVMLTVESLEDGVANIVARQDVPVLEILVNSRYAGLIGSYLNSSVIGEDGGYDFRTALLSSKLGGFIEAALPVPLKVSELSGENFCLGRGHIRVQGDGAVDIRFGASAAGGQGVEYLLNGSDPRFPEECEFPEFLVVPLLLSF